MPDKLHDGTAVFNLVKKLYYAHYTPKEAVEYMHKHAFNNQSMLNTTPAMVTKWYHAFKTSGIKRFDKSTLLK